MTCRTRIVLFTVLMGLKLLAPTSLPTTAATGATATATKTAAVLVGDWQGTLEVGEVQLRLVLHVEAAPEGDGLEATLDSPDQGATGIPVSSVAVEGDGVAIEVRAIGARYDGTLTDGRRTISGEWKQSGRTFRLKMERAADR